MIVILGTIFFYFAGTTFPIYLLFWILAYGLYCGFSIPVIVDNNNAIKTESNVAYIVANIFQNSIYIPNTIMLVWYGLIMIFGVSVLSDVIIDLKLTLFFFSHIQTVSPAESDSCSVFSWSVSMNKSSEKRRKMRGCKGSFWRISCLLPLWEI